MALKQLSGLIKAIRAQLKLHAQPRLLVPAAALLAVLFIVNYRIDLEDSHIDTITSFPLRWLGMFCLQAIPFIATCVLLFKLNLNRSWVSSKGFWSMFILGFSLLSLDRSIDLQTLLLPMLNRHVVDSREVWFIYRIMSKFAGLFTIVIPLLLFYQVMVKLRSQRFYVPANVAFGIRLKDFSVRPYLVLLLLAGAIVWVGGLFADIQAYYPRYMHSGGEIFAGSRAWPEWTVVLMYELAYGFDFISTEFFFRGFLVLFMARYFGPNVLIPMAVSYAVLHFGKPLTEALSSILGGYLLGVLALHHRNIWGGVLIHVGMAWMMELVGYLYK